MMSRRERRGWVSGCCMLAALSVGCQSPRASTGPPHTTRIPRITRLCAQVASARVHRFRKPLRDQRARALRRLSAECARLLDDVGTWEGSAELTAVNADEHDAVRADIRSLRMALAALRSAADRGDSRSVRSAHSTAAAAYARITRRMDPPR